MSDEILFLSCVVQFVSFLFNDFKKNFLFRVIVVCSLPSPLDLISALVLRSVLFFSLPHLIFLTAFLPHLSLSLFFLFAPYNLSFLSRIHKQTLFLSFFFSLSLFQLDICGRVRSKEFCSPEK